MSAVKNTADKRNNANRGAVSDTERKYPESSDVNDDFSVESKGNDHLAVSKENAVSDTEEKNLSSPTEDKDGARMKPKASTDTQPKDPERKEKEKDSSDIGKEKETAASTEKGTSSESKERVKSLLKESESPSGSKDLFYLFQKYADEDGSIKGTDKVTSEFLKKWLEQAKLFDKEAGITEEYTKDLFEKSASETGRINFEEFQEFIYCMAEEKKQSYSELVHKILSAGNPHMESNESEDIREGIEKICSAELPKGEFKEESESGCSDST